MPVPYDDSDALNEQAFDTTDNAVAIALNVGCMLWYGMVWYGILDSYLHFWVSLLPVTIIK